MTSQQAIIELVLFIAHRWPVLNWQLNPHILSTNPNQLNLTNIDFFLL